MIKKKSIILLIFSLIFLGIKAQESAQDTYGCTDWSFGFGLGSVQFFGDLDMGQDLSSAFYLHLNKEIHSNYDLQLEFVKGDITGKELSSDPAKIDEVFYAEFMQYDINLLINISSFFDEKMNSKDCRLNEFIKNRKLNLFTKIGAGLNLFRTKRNELNSGSFINSYGYEWMWQNNFEDAGSIKESWKNTIKEPSFVLGFIIEYQTFGGNKVQFSVVNRSGGGDKWDAKINNKDDMFIFYSLGTTINLSR